MAGDHRTEHVAVGQASDARDPSLRLGASDETEMSGRRDGSVSGLRDEVDRSPKDARDRLDVERALRDVHDEPERGLIIEGHVPSVHVEEHDGREPPEPLVPVDERMVRDERVERAAALPASIG